ncbi:MAG: efflux RND transporter periplasmic adaptor subunit [Candidatus Cloacimonetes bacterium]|nr:efflux RND transporter periplasmic adaptor subunit [Candidatus Cloacimonadota bacterium]
MKKNKLRLIRGAIVIIFLVFLIWRIIGLITKKNNSNFGNNGARAVAVEVTGIKHETIREIKEFTGTIYPSYRYIIAPKISGRLEKINKRIGDFVEENEIVALIDDAEYQQAVLEAQANLRIAEANLAEALSHFELADQELIRVKSLKEKEYISQSELEAASAAYISAQAQVNLANAQIEQRKAALRLAEIRLSYTVLKASKPGFIGERFSDEGSLLAANAPIVSVVGINTVIIRSSLIERIYGRITTGQKAEIETDAFPDMVFSGNVSRISPVLQETSRMAEMEIEVDNESLILKPGMFCKINIVIAEKENAQIVPSRAIVTENNETGIFMVDENEAVARYIPVLIGITTAAESEIIEPVIAGLVITVGQYQLRDGSKILLPVEDQEEQQR